MSSDPEDDCPSCASPPCFMHEVDPDYMGLAGAAAAKLPKQGKAGADMKDAPSSEARQPDGGSLPGATPPSTETPDDKR